MTVDISETWATYRQALHDAVYWRERENEAFRFSREISNAIQYHIGRMKSARWDLLDHEDDEQALVDAMASLAACEAARDALWPNMSGAMDAHHAAYTAHRALRELRLALAHSDG